MLVIVKKKEVWKHLELLYLKKPSEPKNRDCSTKEEDNLQQNNRKVKKSHEMDDVSNQSEAFRIPSM